MALVETILVSVVMIVPLMVVLSALSDLHRGALAVSAAAREAGFEAARSDTVAQADLAVDAAVDAALSDHGIDARGAGVSWNSAGWQRGGRVEVEVKLPIQVFQLPFLGAAPGPRIWLNGRHVARIDPYMSRG